MSANTGRVILPNASYSQSAPPTGWTNTSGNTWQSPDVRNLTQMLAHLIADVTSLQGASPTIIVAIVARDPASGKYYTVLAGAAIATVSTNIYRVLPGGVAGANSVAQDFVPEVFAVQVTFGNASPITFSIGMNLGALGGTP